MEAPTRYNVNRFLLFKASWLPTNQPPVKLPLKPGETGVITASQLQVRTGPNTSYIAIKTLNKGDLVPVTGVKDEWFSIAEDEWVQSKFVEVSFEAKVKRVYREAAILVSDDLQKDRWGGESKSDNWELTAAVTKNELPKSFQVVLSIFSTDKTHSQEAAFFLHDSFGEQVVFTKVVHGKAVLELTAHEAFTVAAYTDDDTRLELDLNEQPGFPEAFYYDSVSVEFKHAVEELYLAREAIVPDSFQKNRWGGKAADKGKELKAVVTNSIRPGYYKVDLSVSSGSNTGQPFEEVAFFLPNNFPDNIRYKRMQNGVAKITVTAREDFIVSAYTADGTLLELDLHESEGFPEGFYARE